MRIQNHPSCSTQPPAAAVRCAPPCARRERSRRRRTQLDGGRRSSKASPSPTGPHRRRKSSWRATRVSSQSSLGRHPVTTSLHAAALDRCIPACCSSCPGVAPDRSRCRPVRTAGLAEGPARGSNGPELGGYCPTHKQFRKHIQPGGRPCESAGNSSDERRDKKLEIL